MAKIVWDEAAEKVYETGVDHGVVYPISSEGAYSNGYCWNGLTSVTESPSGAEPTNLYADNIKYITLMSAEDFGGTIGAYNYPPEFEECDGTASPVNGVSIAQQPRKMFGFSYRTKKGNGVAGQNFGYKLHLIYGCLASPSEKTRDSINESPSAVEFSWSFTTTPVSVNGYAPTAHVILDSTIIGAEAMATIEEVLYGGEEKEPRLPLPDEVFTIIKGVTPTGP